MREKLKWQVEQGKNEKERGRTRVRYGGGGRKTGWRRNMGSRRRIDL